mmetsp:Transcript_2074/g.6053  ORF Transcript_2074/g.6053 Transcript_2074/m.6053 type:complete len:223 (-) Transcript_2074:372-1040(-)
MFDVSETVSSGISDLFRLFGVDSSHSGRQDFLVDGSGRASALFLIIDGPRNSTRWWRIFGESLLEGALSVSNHIHDHKRRSKKVDNRQQCGIGQVDKSSNTRTVGTRGKQRVGSSREKDGNFSRNSSWVEDGKQGVSEPKKRKGCFLGSISGDKGRRIEHVSGNLHQRPRQNHQSSSPLGLSFNGTIDGDQCHDSGSDLHSRDNEWRSNEAKPSMNNLQQGS